MAPKTKEQFESIRQKSIAIIKEAALELFAHNGYHSTSISQIAREAGISKGLMYNYFKGKEDLLNSIIMDAVQEGEEVMAKYLTETDDPYAQLRGITEVSFHMVETNLHYWKLLTSLAFQTDVLKGMETMLKQKQEAAMEQFTAIFAAMGVAEPRKEAYVYGALMDGVMIHYMQTESGYPLEEMRTYIINRYDKPE